MSHELNADRNTFPQRHTLHLLVIIGGMTEPMVSLIQQLADEDDWHLLLAEWGWVEGDMGCNTMLAWPCLVLYCVSS